MSLIANLNHQFLNALGLAGPKGESHIHKMTAYPSRKERRRAGSKSVRIPYDRHLIISVYAQGA